MKRNWLRGVAIALILLPEPFTTPIGAALLAASFLLPKRHKDTLSNIENLVRRYAQFREQTGLNRLFSSTSPMCHTLNRKSSFKQNKPSTDRNNIHYVNRHATPWHEEFYRKSRNEFQHGYLTDSSRVSQNIVYHVLRTSLSQDKTKLARPVFVLYPIKQTESPTPEKYYYRMRPIVKARKENVIHHSLVKN